MPPADFDAPQPQEFQLGVNYWPQSTAMRMWREFPLEQMRGELELIAALGMRVVRIFLLWEDFQHSPEQVNPVALERLRHFADAAAEQGLLLDVTFFTGHMSGPNWAPAWMRAKRQPVPEPRPLVVGSEYLGPEGYKNLFDDHQVDAAAQLLVDQVARTLKGHPALYMWNLGNEPDLFARPRSNAAGAAWVAQYSKQLKAITKDVPVTCGLHVPSIERNVGLRADLVFDQCDLAVMHAYPMYSPWSKAPLDANFVPFCAELTAALSGKPVLLEEFGGATAHPGEPSHRKQWTYAGRKHDQFFANEEDFASYLEAVLHRLWEGGSTGAFLWCFADYARDIWHLPPCSEFVHERHFGLIRPDGSRKPHADVVARFAAKKRVVQPSPRRIAIDDVENYFAAAPHSTRELYEEYLTRL